MNLKKTIALLIVTIFSLTCVGSHLIVSAKNSPTSDKAWEKRRAFLEENMKKLGGQGPEKVKEFLEKNGLSKSEIIADSNNNSSLLRSTNGNVSLYGIQAYQDRISGRYLVQGFWNWNSINYVDTYPGPVDGVSIAMCKTNWDPVTGYILSSNPAGIAVYDQNGDYYATSGAPSTISQSGICYTFSDYWNWIGSSKRYVGYKGSVWFWMDVKPAQLPIYIKMDFVHSYNSGTFSGINIDWQPLKSPTLRMSWASTPVNWPVANQYTLYSWPIR